MKSKKCPNCNEVKLHTEFYKCSTRKDGLQSYCKICKKERFKESKRKSDKKYQEKYYLNPENTARKLEYCKAYQLENLEQQKKYHKKYKNSQKGILTRREYRKKEYQEKYGKDIPWTLKLTLRNRLKNAVKREFKKGKTLELLGCNIDEFKKYIENQFDDKMNWDNYGSYWELDHIRPCDSFNLENLEEQKECFIFTNIQPLEVTQNRIKSNQYE